MRIQKYDIFIFDSDGVILNSNQIKIDAFSKIAELLLEIDCKSLINEFISSNPKSAREDILKFIIKNHFNKNNYLNNLEKENILLQKLLKDYEVLTKSKLLSCEICKSLPKFRSFCKNIPWLLLTLGDEKSTKKIYKERNLIKFFDKGIFGGPATKQENIELIKENLILNNKKVLFFGDTIKDAKLAKSNNFDFIFLSEWSHCKNAKEFCLKNKFKEYSNLEIFINSLIP